MENRTYVDLELTLLSDPATGQTILLPPPVELSRQERTALGYKKDAEATLAQLRAVATLSDAPESLKAEDTIKYADVALAEIAALRSHYEPFKDKGAALTLKVRKPSYGEVLKADGLAQTFDGDTGMIRDNRRNAVADLVSQHVFGADGTTRVSVSEMEPAVGQYLEQFMARMAYPDESRLPFTYLFAGTP